MLAQQQMYLCWVFEGIEKRVHDTTVSAFLGVPFGKAPIGKLRFAPPLPVDPWEDVFVANGSASSCYYTLDTMFPGFPGWLEYL